MRDRQHPETLPELSVAWVALQRQARLRPIRSPADFKRTRALADTLADSVGDDRRHPLYSLFEIVMGLIERWEEQHAPVLEAPPREVLRHLLDANGLRQKDIADIASPALVSDILAGRRAISKRLAKLLAQRFHVDVAAFI